MLIRQRNNKRVITLTEIDNLITRQKKQEYIIAKRKQDKFGGSHTRRTNLKWNNFNKTVVEVEVEITL